MKVDNLSSFQLFQDLPSYKDKLEVTFYTGTIPSLILTHEQRTFSREVGVRACVRACDVSLCPAGRYSSGADRKFALLEDVFKGFPKIPVSIEIKEKNIQLIEKVTRLLVK